MEYYSIIERETGTWRNLEYTVLSAIKSITKNHMFALLNLFHMQNTQIYTDSKLVVATFGGGSDGDIRMRL